MLLIFTITAFLLNFDCKGMDKIESKKESVLE